MITTRTTIKGRANKYEQLQALRKVVKLMEDVTNNGGQIEVSFSSHDRGWNSKNPARVDATVVVRR